MLALLVNDSPGKELVERAEDLILRLRDIQSCRISTDETGKIMEVHVVACSDRPPKMIARDVETCLKAELGLVIDYRKIGVVILNAPRDPKVKKVAPDRFFEDEVKRAEEMVDRLGEEPPAEKPRVQKKEIPEVVKPEMEFLEEDVRIRFNGLHLGIEEDRVNVEVRLAKSGIEVVGSMDTMRPGGPIYETIARATIHALTELLDENFYLCLSEMKEVVIRDRGALVAVVDVIEGRSVKSFTGCVFIGQDQNEAAVLVVLDAVNRPLGRWKSRKEIHYTIK